jgi:hypothetical protein
MYPLPTKRPPQAPINIPLPYTEGKKVKEEKT